MERKSAYIAGGATIAAALVGFVGNSMFNRSSEPSVSTRGDGNNINVVQGSDNVTINQNVNEIDKLRQYEAASMKQSLVSGCDTMLDYFVNRKSFNVDSIDTLIGSVWVQKDKYISYFGAPSQRAAMEMVDKINPLYIEWMPGVYALHNRHVIESSLNLPDDMPMADKERILDSTKRASLESTDRVEADLVDASRLLCNHFRDATYVGG